MNDDEFDELLKRSSLGSSEQPDPFEVVRAAREIARHEQFGDDPTLPVETDFFILAGHPYTCNGGNDVGPWHDHEVLLVRDGDQLRCPECGRTQSLRKLP